MILTPFTPSAFPKFSQLFASPSSSSPLRFLSLGPEEAATALVLENRAAKAVTALRCRWITTDSSGKQRIHIASSDSYMVDAYRPVIGPGARQLITRSGRVDEDLIDHLLAGGGCIGSGSGSHGRMPDAVQITFEVNFILFEDGEIAGSDPELYALELQCRKRGAEFVAQHIRLAAAEGRDVTPVLSALAEIPHFGRLGHSQGDRLVQWTQYYAKDYLQAMRRENPSAYPGLDWREIKLRHLENRPELPKFYRRGQ